MVHLAISPLQTMKIWKKYWRQSYKQLCVFFERYPTKMIYFEGSTPERTRLYQIVIAREHPEIEKVFSVYGISNSTLEPFLKNQNYSAFDIALRNRENLLKLLYENNKS